MRCLNYVSIFAALAVLSLTPRLALCADPVETIIYDEAKQGDFPVVAPNTPPTIKISKPGVQVIQGTGTDTIDDSDQFVFEVTGDKPFDFCLLADPAEFKKLRSVDADGKDKEIAFGSTNPKFRAPRNISKTELPPGKYHVEMHMGPDGVVGTWTAKFAIRDGGPVVDLCKEPGEPTVAEKMKEVQWPGIVSIFHGAGWGADLKYLQAIKECGFGAAGCSEAQIPEVRQQDMKAFVFIWPHEVTIIPPKFKDDKTVLCYYLSDRIPPNKWAAWASQEKLAWRADPHHPAVFTMYAMMGGIPQFPDVVRGRLMEFYHYHWDGRRHPHMHFPVLEAYRQASLKNGNVPICLIAETRAEDVRKTRETIYTALAYGVRGFRTGGSGLFDTKNRDDRGVPKRTIHGEEALKFNQAIKSYSPIFETARSVDVFHTAPLPGGTKEAPADYWVRPSGEHVIVGEFADPKKNRFLMLANRDAFNAHEATLTFTDGSVKVERMDKPSGEWKPLNMEGKGKTTTVKVPLEEGGGELLRVRS